MDVLLTGISVNFSSHTYILTYGEDDDDDFPIY